MDIQTEKLKPNFEKWLVENEDKVENLIRAEDSIFREVLYYTPDIGFFLNTQTSGTSIEGCIMIRSFMNGQDLANMDTTDYEDDKGNIDIGCLIGEEIEAVRERLENDLNGGDLNEW